MIIPTPIIISYMFIRFKLVEIILSIMNLINRIIFVYNVTINNQIKTHNKTKSNIYLTFLGEELNMKKKKKKTIYIIT